MKSEMQILRVYLVGQICNGKTKLLSYTNVCSSMVNLKWLLWFLHNPYDAENCGKIIDELVGF